MADYDLTLVNVGPNVPRHKDGRMLKPPPLGVLTLAGFIRDHGYSVQVLDYQLNDYAIEEQLLPSSFARFLGERIKAPLLGVSTMGGMMPVVLLGLEEFKKQHKEIPVILGGAGPSNGPSEILKCFPAIDIVVNGEGEEPLLALMRSLDSASSIAGVVSRSGNNIIENPQGPRIMDADTLSAPAWDLIDLDRYLVACIVTARGCPFSCEFCEVPRFWGNRVTRRSMDLIIDELKMLRRLGKRQININDDTFVYNKKWVIEFCKRLIDEKVDISWECFGRVELMNETMITWMVKAGCTGIFYGIESGNDEILAKMVKGLTISKARETVKISVKHFKRVYTSFIWGFPYESMDQFFDTVMVMTEFAGMGAQVMRNYLTLRPMAPLYDDYKDQMLYSDDLPYQFLEVPRKLLPPEVIDAIKTYPGLFPGFYYVASPEFEEKRRFMEWLESLGPGRWEILNNKVSGIIAA